MKEWTLSALAVALMALLIGLLFHWVYPSVEPSTELAGLFGFLALLLRVAGGRLASLWRRPPAAEEPKVNP